MRIECPGCGRAYDPALFAGGRTIHCACGQRVGPAAALRTRLPGDPLRFMVDAMLGQLARWLRILGYDAAYEADIEDRDLVERARVEHRVILTRDTRLPTEWRVSDIHLVAAERPREQLREVVGAFRLTAGAGLFTRCSRCNATVQPVDRDEVRRRVPSDVLDSQRDFRRCPVCDRVYWDGSHARRMRRIIDDVVGSR